MRQIKFRAKYLSNGKWAYWTLTEDMTEENLNWETLGEWTGLHDKNGKEIYEGDIVKYKFADEYIEVIKWSNWNDEMVGGSGFALPFFFEEGKDCEVIGNIWENKELLKEEKND